MTKTVKKSVLIWYSAQQMFDLVSDVPRYSEFLPWCSKGRIVQQLPDGVLASVEMSLAGIQRSFTTHNTHQPPHRLDVVLVDGPFSVLRGSWMFQSIAPAACRVDFSLEYAFTSSVISAAISPLFDKIAASLVDAFVQRAEAVYGI